VARRLLTATIATLLLVPAASALAAPHVVVWSGGLAPGSAAIGVELQADGSGHVLTGDTSGVMHTGAAFVAKGAHLAAIRSAASSLLNAGPSVTDAGLQDGGYVTVLVEDGAKRRAIADSGTDAAGVAALVNALNAALPAGSRLPGATGTIARADGGRRARDVRTAPSTAACPPGQNATDVVKTVPMQTAAAAGIVQLTPKGTFLGDSVAVDGTWKPVRAPTTVTVHLEISQAADDGTDWPSVLKGLLDSKYAGYKVDGQPVNFVFDTVARAASAAPRPCYHEIFMDSDNRNLRSYVDDVGPAPQGGEWSVFDRPLAAPHEVGQLLSIDDHYSDYFHITRTGANVKLPDNGLEGDALQAALPAGIRASDGYVFSKPWPGYGKDLMATGKGRLRQTDLNRIVAGADIVVHDDPGDVLVNKSPADQNLITAAPFDLRIPKGQHAHVDGLVAYCIDLSRHIPGTTSNAFDALGQASALGGDAMTALQRVVDVIAARQPGPLQAVPGANDAIWRITDDTDATSDPDAVSILQAAGVPPAASGHTYAAPHINDSVGGTQTMALSLSGPVPAPAPPIEGVLPPANVAPSLAALSVTPRGPRVRSKRTVTVLTAQLTVIGAPDTLTLSLTRTGHKRTTTVAHSRPQGVAVGQAMLSLVARGLRPGTYRLVVRDTAGRRLQATVRVRGR
jgi:hypothetical protein